MLMHDDHIAGAAVDEPLLLILLGERAAAACLEEEWRREARVGLQALVQQPMAEPADLLALAWRLGGKCENGSTTGPFERDRRVS